MADVAVDPASNSPSELLGQGIKALILQDYDASVAALSRASELLVKEHNNDLHDSLGDVYLYYGKALLGLSREQNEALGDAVPKDDGEDDEDDDEGIETEDTENTENEQNEENAKNETPEETSTAENKPLETEKGKSDDKNGEVESKNGEAKPNGEPDVAVNGEPGPSSSKPDEPDSTEDASQDDEASDLQLAWEVLELAKKIFERQGDKAKKNLAETLIVLGEVSLESENFESAINDIKHGLELQKSIFEQDSRTLAETYYKLGVAYSTDSQMSESIESFQKSLEYLQNRISSLEKAESSEQIKEEIEEIKGLIPDIEEKIADMKSSKEEVGEDCSQCREIIQHIVHPILEKVKNGVTTSDDDKKINVLQPRRKSDIESAVNKLKIDNE